jgi:hypothetical protein
MKAQLVKLLKLESVAVRWPAKRAEPFMFALIFLLHFLHGGKKWKGKTESRKHDSSKVRSLLRRDDKG